MRIPVPVLTDRALLPPFPAVGGTYVLHLLLAEPRTIRVGALGVRQFPAGHLAYVGSAWGPGGLAARLRRHLALEKPCRWHLDYLRPLASVRAAWFAAGGKPRETAWVSLLADCPGMLGTIPGFGASDSPCASHLFAFSCPPQLTDFQRLCHARFPEDPAIREWLAAPLA